MGGLFVGAAVTAVVLLTVFGILGPFLRGMSGNVLTYRFLTTDFIWLIVLLQFPLAFLFRTRSQFVGEGVSALAVFLTVLIVLPIGIAWILGTAVLSESRVFSMFRRGVFLVVLLPVTLLGAIFGIPLTIMLIGFLQRFDLDTTIAIPLGIGALLSLIFGFRKLSEWVLAGARSELDTPGSDTD